MLVLYFNMNYGTFGKGRVEDSHRFLVIYASYGNKGSVVQKLSFQPQFSSKIFTGIDCFIMAKHGVHCTYLEIPSGMSCSCLSH